MCVGGFQNRLWDDMIRLVVHLMMFQFNANVMWTLSIMVWSAHNYQPTMLCVCLEIEAVAGHPLSLVGLISELSNTQLHLCCRAQCKCGSVCCVVVVSVIQCIANRNSRVGLGRYLRTLSLASVNQPLVMSI